MIKGLIDYYFRGGRKQHYYEQGKLEYMMFNTNHDIGMLPGGFYIHYSFCDECKAAKSKQDKDK